MNAQGGDEPPESLATLAATFILKTVRMASSRKFFGESARLMSSALVRGVRGVGWSVPLQYLLSDSQRGLSRCAHRARPEKIRQALRELPRGHGDQVEIFCRGIWREFVRSLLERAGCPRDVDLVSIDIDGCDYHVFESITIFSRNSLHLSTTAQSQ